MSGAFFAFLEHFVVIKHVKTGASFGLSASWSLQPL